MLAALAARARPERLRAGQCPIAYGQATSSAAHARWQSSGIGVIRPACSQIHGHVPCSSLSVTPARTVDIARAALAHLIPVQIARKLISIIGP